MVLNKTTKNSNCDKSVDRHFGMELKSDFREKREKMRRKQMKLKIRNSLFGSRSSNDVWADFKSYFNHFYSEMKLNFEAINRIRVTFTRRNEVKAGKMQRKTNFSNE